MTPLAPPDPYGYPAPLWVLETLKVIGFTLHASMMNLWFAGMPLAFLLALTRNPNARQLAARLGSAMPAILALGINFGIIPLLFTQVVNYRFFYPATILIAWPWFSIVAFVLVAYYAAYVYARSRSRRLAVAGAGISAVLLVVTGFCFTNGFSLMTNPPQWIEIFHRTAPEAAPSGLALNLGDPTLFPRWFMMFGLAITTTAAAIALDTALLARREPAAYRTSAGRLAFLLYSFGIVWYAGFGSWYFFGTLSSSVQRAILASPAIIALMAVTAAAPGLPWLLLAGWRKIGTPIFTTLAGIAQFGVIGLNAVSRQWVQNVEMRPYENLALAPHHTQWTALIIFLVLLTAAMWFSAWLALKLHAAFRQA